MPTPNSQGKAVEQIPMVTSLQPEQAQTGKANTGMATNDTYQNTLEPYPTEPISNEKTTTASKQAAVRKGLERLSRFGKQASAPASSNPFINYLRKMAEDAINPAHVSAPGDTTPPFSESGQAGPAEPSDVNSQKNMISSNTAAIDYTKREAKQDPIKDVEQVVSEPAMSAANDKTLNMVLDHVDEAGAKISMVKNAHQIAAARALLMKLAQEEAEKTEEEKKKEEEAKKKEEESSKKDEGGNSFPFESQKMNKEKESQMMQASFQGPPATPAGASGFSSSSMRPGM
jgi:hypothetical protein